jgi:hemoglobin
MRRRQSNSNVLTTWARTLVVGGVLVLFAVALALACAGTPKPLPTVPEVPIDAGEPDVAPPEPAPAPPPLYARLGGSDGVAALVDSFADDLLADRRLKRAFAKTKKGPKLDHFKQMLRDQICEVSGGDCHYAGKTMSDAHAAMRITSAQFDAFIDDLKLALDEKQVSKDDAQQLLDQLTLLKDQIVAPKH